MSKNNKSKTDRSLEVLEDTSLLYAPQNELGFLFFFGHLAPKTPICVEEFRPGLPDFITYEKTENGEKRTRIEIKDKSKIFSLQSMNHTGATGSSVCSTTITRYLKEQK